MMTFGEAIRKIRLIKGMSQLKLEEGSGILREYLSKIENGELPNPTLKTIRKLAAALGTTASALLAKTESGRTNPFELRMSIEDLARFKKISREEGARAEKRRIANLIEDTKRT